MSKVIAKVNYSWNIQDPDITNISSSYLHEIWRKNYYITLNPKGYYLQFTYLED